MAYKMTHPSSETEIKVDASSVSTYKTQGWQIKPTAKEPDPKPDEK